MSSTYSTTALHPSLTCYYPSRRLQHLLSIPRFNTHTGSASWAESGDWKLFFGETMLSESLVLFFVIHPDEWFPFQKRFQTSQLQEVVNDYLSSASATVTVTAVSMSVGGAIGSILPGPGTVAGGMLGTVAGVLITEAFTAIVREFSDGILGQYLRYIG